MDRVLRDVAAERGRQDEKWGVQRHSWVEWMSVLAEEVGEAAERANKAHWRDGHEEPVGREKLRLLRLELVQVAAVAVAVAEHVDEALGEG